MNYFRCTVGGSGKGNTVTVTCAEEFAGLTITLAKTGKTYTKTCPSTAPYTVTFNGVENGTYTVSTLYNGRTYSEVVLVQDISCDLSYGFSWGTWVNTASELNLSDYDSLDELLADESAVRELFLEHACVDYMASVAESNNDIETIINNDICAKWINLSDYALDYLYANEVIADLMDEADKYFYGEWALMPQVPTMTSNTAPYGEAIGDATQSGGPLYYAFDNNDTTRVYQPSSTTHRVGYHFTSSVTIKKFDFYVTSDGIYTHIITLQCSDDGTTWTDVGVYSANSNSKYSFNVDASYNAAYWRVESKLSTEAAYSYPVTTLQFYAYAPKGNVPKMTSDTAPYGKVISSGANSSDYAWKAFDDDPATMFTSTGSSGGEFIGYKFVNPVNVRKIYLRLRRLNSAGTENYEFMGSNDNSTWTSLKTFSHTYAEVGVAENFTEDITNTNYYLYYKLVRTSGVNRLYALDFQLYGRELKVSVPVMTGDTAPYGEAFGSSLLASNYHYYNAFTPEGITVSSTKYGWLPASNETTNCYVGYDFGRKVKIAYVEVQEVAGSGSAANNSTVIEGSDDGSNYSAMSESITITRTKTGHVLSADEHRYFRMFFSTISGTGNRGVICNFYGLDYSEKEFESGTTKKWLYDHGVELETISAVTSSDTTFVTKNADNVEVQTTTTGTNRIASAYAVVDTSPFSIARCKFGEVFNPTTNNIEFAVYSALPNYSQSGCSGYVYFANGNSDLPYNCSLDISSVNLAAGYISVASRSSSTGYVRDAKLYELWLE